MFELTIILLAALVIAWRVYCAAQRRKHSSTPTPTPPPVLALYGIEATEVDPDTFEPLPDTPPVLVLAATSSSEHQEAPAPTPPAAVPVNGDTYNLGLPDWMLDELAAYEASLIEAGAPEVPPQPEQTPEPEEPYYEPAQLQLDREVQLAAAMREAVPDPEPPHILDTSIPRLPVGKIVAGENDRTAFEPVALAELADDIAANGLAQPITVRPMYRCASCGHSGPLTGNRCKACVETLGEDSHWYQIVAGERRFRAISALLNWPDAPVIIRSMTDKEASAVMLSENLKRVDLNPLDEANAYKKRIDKEGWTIAECAKNANVPAARVKGRLALLLLIPDAQALVRSGNLGVGYAECMGDLDANRQAQALQYFNVARRPNLADFRALCGELLAEQAQDSLFDMDAFMTGQNEQNELEEVARKVKRYPTHDRLPSMARAKTVGAALECYIADLLSSEELDVREAAAVVGTVYDGLMRSGLARPPKESPLVLPIPVNEPVENLGDNYPQVVENSVLVAA
jgi:ParB/RepB/Spo0J family partition protein